MKIGNNRIFLVVTLLCSVNVHVQADTDSLLDAARKASPAAIELLVKQGGDVNARQADGTSVLSWSVYHDLTGTSQLLIRSGADVNAANDLGVTPLILACENGNAILVKNLLDAGADPDKAKITGVTPLMACSDMGATAAVDALIRYGADVNAGENSEDQTPLMWAAAGNHSDVVRLLIDAGADVNAVSRKLDEPEPYIIKDENIVFGWNYPTTIRFPEFSGGFTALYFAAQQGNLESARLLVEAGADVNAVNSEYGSPLIIALKSGHEETARFLLDSGADPNASDAWGITALHYALHWGILIINTFKPSETDRFGWLRQNMPRMVKALLEKGADPNARIKYSLPFTNDPFFERAMEDPPQVDPVGATPLHIAAISGDIESMKILLAHGADKAAKTVGGGTLFMFAAGLGAERGTRKQSEAIEAAKFVLSLGDVDINAQLTEIAEVGPGKGKPDGRTAMHQAVYFGWTDMIRFLARNGADLEAEDRYGMTPMLMAHGDPEGRLFRQIGAGNADFRFRSPPPIERENLTALLEELGAEPFTGTYRDRSGE